MDNLILCGLPFSGKSFLGAKLAQALSWSFIDTDRLIEQQYRQKNSFLSCREIFAGEGEDYFRQLERQVIEQLSGAKKNVIALGGGAFHCSETVPVLKNMGKIIYLKAPLDLVINRLKQKKSVPAYLSAHSAISDFMALAEKRAPLYESHAHFTIDVDQHTHAATVLEALKISL